MENVILLGKKQTKQALPWRAKQRNVVTHEPLRIKARHDDRRRKGATTCYRDPRNKAGLKAENQPMQEPCNLLPLPGGSCSLAGLSLEAENTRLRGLPPSRMALPVQSET